MNRKQGQANKAAEKRTTDIVRESNNGAVADQAVSDQKIGIELMQTFFNGVINSLYTQAHSNREVARQLSNQQQRAQEAIRTLAVDAVGAYMDFANSTFFFYQGGLERAGRSASPSSNGHRAVSQVRNGKLPVENYDYYDSLNAKEAIAKMEGLSVEEVEHLRDHEVSNKDRSTVTDRFNARIEAIEANLPVENYDSLGVVEILDKMEELGVEEIKRLRSYEATTKKRPTLMDRFNDRVEEDSA